LSLAVLWIWIRVDFGRWIRIRIDFDRWFRIQEGKNDPTKIGKSEEVLCFKCWMFSLEG
jgi:hypothetical protein